MPICPGAGVSVTVRLLSEPPKTMLALGSRVGLAETPETVRSAAGVSGSPIVKGMGGVPESTRELVGGTVEITGAMFDGRTVTEKVVLFDFAPVSVTQMVIAEDPA